MPFVEPRLATKTVEEIWSKTADTDSVDEDIESQIRTDRKKDEKREDAWVTGDEEGLQQYAHRLLTSLDGPSEDSESFRPLTKDEIIRLVDSEKRRNAEDRRQQDRGTPDRRVTSE